MNRKEPTRGEIAIVTIRTAATGIIESIIIRKTTIEITKIIIINKKRKQPPKKMLKPLASNSTRMAHHDSRTVKSRIQLQRNRKNKT